VKRLALPAAAIIFVVFPGAAHAAALAVSPVKPCYRSGEQVGLAGSGYTPNGGVNIASDGSPLGTAMADGTGVFSGRLTVAVPSGERVRSYTATDQTNGANTATIPLRVSAFSINVRPSRFVPGALFRIRARGFTTGSRLYVHIVRGRTKRNIALGRLRGACRTLSVRKRMFARGSAFGTYTVQFDTRRRYSSKTAVRKRYSAILYPTGFASAASMRLTPLR
jgi:hypothetical protein